MQYLHLYLLRILRLQTLQIYNVGEGGLEPPVPKGNGLFYVKESNL